MDRRRFLLGTATVPVVGIKESSSDVPNTIDELTARIESMYSCFDGPLGPKALTGENYSIIRGDRVKNSGERWLGLTSKEFAVNAAWFAFLAHTSGKSGRLYWRARPEIAQNNRLYSCYMRFLVTNKPELKLYQGKLPEETYGTYLGKTKHGSAYMIDLDEKKYVYYGPEPRQTHEEFSTSSGQLFKSVSWSALG